MTTVGGLVYQFFEHHLKAERGLSQASIRSYRDGIRLFLLVMAKTAGHPLSKLALSDLSAENVRAFLTYLEAERGAAIPRKRTQPPATRYLERDEVEGETDNFRCACAGIVQKQEESRRCVAKGLIADRQSPVSRQAGEQLHRATGLGTPAARQSPWQGRQVEDLPVVAQDGTGNRGDAVDLNVIRGWLGHVSLDTTNRYAEINIRMKQEALEACQPPSTGETSPKTSLAERTKAARMARCPLIDMWPVVLAVTAIRGGSPHNRGRHKTTIMFSRT